MCVRVYKSAGVCACVSMCVCACMHACMYIKQLYHDIKARLTFNGALSEEIDVDNGVKHSCTNSPPPDYAVFPSHAFQDMEAGVSIRFRSTGKVRT